MASDTRERILEVAGRLFEADGFEGTTVSAILSEAGVNSGSLYHFFPSKEALLVSVLCHHVEGLAGLLDDAKRASPEPLERVFALLDLYRGRLLVSGFTRGCPVGDLASEIGAKHVEARDVIAEYFERWRVGVAEWLREAMGGARSPRSTIGQLSAQVLATMLGGSVQARAAASIEPFDAAVGQLRRYLESRIEAPAEPNRSAASARAGATRRPSQPAARRDRGPAVEVAADPAALRVTGSMEEEQEGDEPAGWRAW